MRVYPPAKKKYSKMTSAELFESFEIINEEKFRAQLEKTNPEIRIKNAIAKLEHVIQGMLFIRLY